MQAKIGRNQHQLGRLQLRGNVRRHAVANGIAHYDDLLGGETLAYILRHALGIGEQIGLAADLPAAFAVAAIVKHIAIVAQLGKALRHFAPAIQRACVAVEKQNRAFGAGMGRVKMQPVKHRAVYGQGDFFMRQPESVGVVGGEFAGVEQQVL